METGFLFLKNVIFNAKYVIQLLIPVLPANLETSETLLLLAFVNQAIMIQKEYPKIVFNALWVALHGKNTLYNLINLRYIYY